ncbi:MAG: hypothetical protein A2Y02_00850 [Omnitrophica bacterium GWA2_52_12]|nr:MAG: hypothetical protein A2Y02_00850 [Omnitrophica bacterium GWA2_52_12]
MAFNSLTFFLFCLAVYPLYWALRRRGQNKLLLAASFFFYGFWDWRFLGLLILTIVMDAACAVQIAGSVSAGRRRFFLALSLTTHLVILGFFKYFHFFQTSLIQLLEILGLQADPVTFQVILPVGISFYTFQSMSYVIDVYRGAVRPAANPWDYALYVSFFPQLVAGPIERSQRLLPQFEAPRTITRHRLAEGAWLVLWGLYKKTYVADGLAALVRPVFDGPGTASGGDILIALYAFAFQIYGDFSGYSDMARGLAKLLGFELSINFGMPYRVTSLRQFWRHWHVSLSEWMRDYVYIPLGGSRGGEWQTYRNLLLTMLAAGLWHGAGWTFVCWGFYHGILLVLEHAWQQHRGRRTDPNHPRSIWVRAALQLLIFHLVCLGWIFFRAGSMTQCGQLLDTLFFHFSPPSAAALLSFFASIWFLGVIAWTAPPFEGGLIVFRWPWWIRGIVYFMVFYSIVIWGAADGHPFIYFQF